MSNKLPTPGEILQGILLLMVLVPAVQWGMMGIGLLLIVFHHWIIGAIIGGIGAVLRIIISRAGL